MPHDINSQQSFEAFPLNPNGQSKNMGAHDRIPPDPAISRHMHIVEFAGGAFRNTTLQPDQWRQTSSGSSSWREINPRTTPFIQPELAAPSPPAGDRGEDNPACHQSGSPEPSVQLPPQPEVQIGSGPDPMQPPPAMVAARQHRRGRPRKITSNAATMTPPPQALDLRRPEDDGPRRVP